MHASIARGLEARVSGRDVFIARAYGTLLGALLFFVVLEIVWFQSGVADGVIAVVSRVPWLAVLGAYLIVAWFAARAAHRVKALPLQVLCLLGFVTAKSLIFVPLIARAERAAPGVLESAVLVSALGFVALTALAIGSRRDFRTLAVIVRWGFAAGLIAIIVAAVFGFGLGPMFSVAMLALAGASIIADTARVVRRYPERRFIAAGLELFSSAAMLFWYVLRLATRRQ